MPSFMSLVETVLCATDLLDGWQRLIVTWFLCVWYAWFLVFFFLTCLRGWMRLTSLLGRVRCGRGKSFRYSFLAGADNVNCFLHRDGLIKVKDLKDSELLSKTKWRIKTVGYIVECYKAIFIQMVISIVFKKCEIK